MSDTVLLQTRAGLDSQAHTPTDTYSHTLTHTQMHTLSGRVFLLLKRRQQSPATAMSFNFRRRKKRKNHNMKKTSSGLTALWVWGLTLKLVSSLWWVWTSSLFTSVDICGQDSSVRQTSSTRLHSHSQSINQFFLIFYLLIQNIKALYKTYLENRV